MAAMYDLATQTGTCHQITDTQLYIGSRRMMSGVRFHEHQTQQHAYLSCRACCTYLVRLGLPATALGAALGAALRVPVGAALGAALGAAT